MNNTTHLKGHDLKKIVWLLKIWAPAPARKKIIGAGKLQALIPLKKLNV